MLLREVTRYTARKLHCVILHSPFHTLAGLRLTAYIAIAVSDPDGMQDRQHNLLQREQTSLAQWSVQNITVDRNAIHDHCRRASCISGIQEA
jgi:hypothetical protein